MADTAVEQLARIHPGTVRHVMDHYVMDLRDPGSGAAAYLTVYSLAWMPEVGTGQLALLHVRDADGRDTIDVTLAEDPEAGRRMQARLKRLIATSDTSRGIGTDLDAEPIPATFERLPIQDGRFTYRIRADGLAVDATWSRMGSSRRRAAASTTPATSRGR
jgi:hypothetical protein